MGRQIPAGQSVYKLAQLDTPQDERGFCAVGVSSIYTWAIYVLFFELGGSSYDKASRATFQRLGC